MKIERAEDLIYWTYHMLKWDEVKQDPSDRKCVQCGRPMLEVGPVEDARGTMFLGIVCHNCKRVIWVKEA